MSMHTCRASIADIFLIPVFFRYRTRDLRVDYAVIIRRGRRLHFAPYRAKKETFANSGLYTEIYATHVCACISHLCFYFQDTWGVPYCSYRTRQRINRLCYKTHRQCTHSGCTCRTRSHRSACFSQLMLWTALCPSLRTQSPLAPCSGGERRVYSFNRKNVTNRYKIHDFDIILIPTA